MTDEPDSPLNGFEISVKWPSEEGDGQMIEKRFVAIARLKDDATASVLRRAPRPATTKLLASGPSTLEKARAQGIKEGEVFEVGQGTP